MAMETLSGTFQNTSSSPAPVKVMVTANWAGARSRQALVPDASPIAHALAAAGDEGAQPFQVRLALRIVRRHDDEIGVLSSGMKVCEEYG